jgi:acyl dehydratase
LDRVLSPDKYKEGDNLPSIVRHIKQQDINLYAEGSGDFNPIHIDESFAAQTPLGGTIAHGMLMLAYISEMMTNVFGNNWSSTGKLSVRFKTPARPEDTITVTGKVSSIMQKEGVSCINCEVESQNQNGEVVVTGTATVQ